MMQLLIESAVRSLVLAMAVYAGLRIFRVRDVRVEKTAWIVVLFGALALPVLLAVSARLPLPVAKVVLPWTSAQPAAAPMVAARNDFSPLLDRHEISAENSAPASANRIQASGEPTVDAAPVSVAPPTATHSVPRLLPWSLAEVAVLLYFAVAAGLLLRLGLGLAIAAMLWRRSEPVDEAAKRASSGANLRCTRAIASPVTIGRGILLPANYAEWDSEKLRIVVAHERSHVRQGDFWLQTLARLYAALIWPSPLGWWLQRRLSDLSEAIGDCEGLEEAESRSSYAQILLEFAALPRPAKTGVAMARSSSIARRIERLLNESTFSQAFAGGQRALAASLLVPAVLFAAAALVRVDAQSRTALTTEAQAVKQAAAAEAQLAKAQPALNEAHALAPQAAPGPHTQIQIPPIHLDVPAVHVDVPEQHIAVPATKINVPAVHVNMPVKSIDIPARQINVPAVHIDRPPAHIDVPAQQISIPAVQLDPPVAGAQNSSNGPAPTRLSGVLEAMLTGFANPFHLRADPPAAEAEATFDRTLTFNGKLDLQVLNGAGNIHFTTGPAGHVRIHGRVHSSRAGEAAQVNEIAGNPPIVQNGDVVRIGAQHRLRTNHIQIDYEIEAPADSMLEAESGSGNITDEGVGQGAKLTTGSGDVRATKLLGGFKVETGSGNITVRDAGAGEAKAEAGSGDIEIDGVRGALKAQAGSGNIRVVGSPTTAWKLETGSGNVDLTPGSAGLTLDAFTGSGRISSERAMEMKTSAHGHQMTGQLNGGGPSVQIETGSGDIRVH